VQVDIEINRAPKALHKCHGAALRRQRQRVALGRAIVRPVSLYLLDESIGRLDAKLRHRMRGELKAMSADPGATIVLVRTASREALGDRVAILREGHLRRSGLSTTNHASRTLR
jgi:ABC-type sugar transport system ATPase subunit